ncbi:hypothetical protein V6N11_040240 [Hibiscus sabdariffa]|uniref:Uncharacterized protein n=1 Tax=Hibiscus sabdariffa TaxID=183260 RepID=A0ABR2RH95_9ROSI
MAVLHSCRGYKHETNQRRTCGKRSNEEITTVEERVIRHEDWEEPKVWYGTEQESEYGRDVCVRIGRLSLQKPENYTKWDPYLTAYPYLMISFFFFWAQTNKGQKLEKAKKNQHKQLTMVQHHAALLTDAADPQQRASELILQPTDHILVPNKAP